MRFLNTIQKLTLATLLVLSLGACSNKDTNDANAIGETTETSQGGGEDGSTTNSTGTTTSTSGGSTDETTDSSNDDTTTDDNTSTENNETNPVDVNAAATLKSLTLTLAKSTLNKDETTDLSLQATYANNTSKTLTNNIEWIVNPTENVEVNGSVLRAKKDGNVTVQATIDGVNSNTIALNITWVVDGYVLPPEPDKTLNDSTLLGIDTNNNGVRDDVERWIYETYNEYIPCHQELDYTDMTFIEGKSLPNAIEVCEENPIPYHPIVRAVAMQGARAAQIIIQEPERAKETLPILDAALNCNAYFGFWAKVNRDPILIPSETTFDKKFKNVQFNTTRRVRAYTKFNYYLSGGVYPSKIATEMKKDCTFDIIELLKSDK